MPAPTPKEVIISSKSFADGWWTIDCTITNGSATRGGPLSVEFHEDATDEELKALLADLYV